MAYSEVFKYGKKNKYFDAILPVYEELAKRAGCVSYYDARKDLIKANGVTLDRSGVRTQYNYVNELNYNPTTWAEWVTSGGSVTKNINGLTLAADGTNWQIARLTGNYKVNTKYGMLYDIIESTITLTFATPAVDAFGNYPLAITVGCKKLVMTTPATITNNRLGLTINNAEPAGNKITIKNIRIFELPAGSSIEADFTNLSADELNAKYPMSFGQQTASRGNDITWNNFAGTSASGLVVAPKVLGKNLIDINATYFKGGNVVVTRIPNGINLKGSSSGYDRITFTIQLKPNTQYTASRVISIISAGTVTQNGYFRVIASDGTTILGSINKSIPYGSATFITPADGIATIGLYATWTTAEATEFNFTNIQVEEGAVATTYESYRAVMLPFRRLDGTDDFGSMVNTASIDITSAPLAEFATLRIPSISQTGFLFCKNIDLAANAQYSLVFDNTNNYFQAYIEGLPRGLSPTITRDVFIDIGWIWDGTTVKYYKNLVTGGNNGAYSGSLTSRPNVRIGRRESAAAHLKGDLANHAIYAGANAVESKILKSRAAISKAYI